MYKEWLAKYNLVPREEYRRCNLPEKETKILCEDGLPELDFLNNVQGKIYLDTDEIQRHYADYGYQPVLENKYIVIGNAEGTYICINEKNEIVYVEFLYKNPVGFINSNLECFLEFLAIEELECNAKMEYCKEDSEQLKILEEMEQRFKEIDSRALDNSENWWSVNLEDRKTLSGEWETEIE